MSVSIAHISDPHFGTEVSEAVVALRAQLLDMQPAMIVLSGDLTQRARPREFSAAAKFVQSLSPLPVMVVPGNHDIPLYNYAERMLLPYRRILREFPDALAPYCRLPGVELFGFTSAPYWRHKDGELDPAAVAARLTGQRGSDGFRVAVLHHPLDCRRPSDERNVIRDSQALVATLSAHGVDLTLGGHIHDPLVTVSRHRYPRTQRSLVLALAGTCLSNRVRFGAPNSFNWITLERGPAPRQTLQRWDFGLDDRFRPVEEHRFERHADRGWVEA
jgi:3',5'-cyclic AMP phosphodiesterase CpdA